MLSEQACIIEEYEKFALFAELKTRNFLRLNENNLLESRKDLDIGSG